jgi:hypothetical protein
MAAILGHVRFNAREFRDLMAVGLRIFTQHPSAARATTGRAEFDDLLDLVKRFE